MTDRRPYETPHLDGPHRADRWTNRLGRLLCAHGWHRPRSGPASKTGLRLPVCTRCGATQAFGAWW